MKRFVDENGTFEIKIPTTWIYSLKSGKVHTFQDYEIWQYDTFQLSIIDAKEKSVKENFLRITKNLPITKINGISYYSYPDSIGDEFIVKAWTTLLGRKIVLFSLTYPVKQNSKLNEKIALVYQIISGFRLIEGAKSEDKINWYRFDMFLQGIAATAYMLNMAVGNKSFIEATCLLASQIDGLLRTGIILQKQVVNRNSEIEREWIYQGIKDKKKSEKDVYKEAKKLMIIDDKTFDDLFKLYDDRNRVIHRFIISEITVAEVEEIAYQYYKMQQKINKAIYDIESKQIELNLGMTRKGDGSKNIDHKKYIKGKMGKISYFDEKE